MIDRLCDYCVDKALTDTSAEDDNGGVCWRPVPDPRNPKWLLTEIVVGGVVKATVSNPRPRSCVCARPPAGPNRVYGNSSDPAWPHLCPQCGYHAAVVDESGQVLRCRNHACRYFCPILQSEVNEVLARLRRQQRKN